MTINDATDAYYCTNNNAELIRIFVIRHGQTEHNVKKILQGQTDTSINTRGRSQALKLGEYLGEQGIKFDKVVSSDLKRCRETVECFLGESTRLGCVDADTDADMDADVDVEFTEKFRERFMGPLEGLHVSEAEKYVARHQDESGLGSGSGSKSWGDFGEKIASFNERVTNALAEVVRDAEENDLRNVAVVSHGGAIRALLRFVDPSTGAHQKIVVFNTSVTIIDYVVATKQLVLREIGNTRHLGNGTFVVSDLRLR